MTDFKQVTIGDEVIRLEPFSGRKAIRVIRTIERITKGVPAILDEWASFTRNYEASNAKETDRAAARYFFAPQPLMDEKPLLDDEKLMVRDAVGDVVMYRTPHLDENGEPVLGPDPLGHMTDKDWEASGNKLRLPQSPSLEEKVAAVFPMAIDLAEEQVTQLLALLAMSNKEVSKGQREGNLMDKLHERSEELLDAPATDLMELAVAAGELVEDQFSSKVKSLGERLPNVLRLFGLSPKSLSTSPEETLNGSSQETKLTSSTDSPTPTDGESDEPSTELAGASSRPSATG